MENVVCLFVCRLESRSCQSQVGGSSDRISFLKDQVSPGMQLPARRMATKASTKTTFEADKVISPLYSGGSVALSGDGRILATCLAEDVVLTDLTTGQRLAQIEGVSSLLRTYIDDG